MKDLGRRYVIEDHTDDTLTVVAQSTNHMGSRVLLEATIADGDPAPFYLTPERARELAVALYNAADTADREDR